MPRRAKGTVPATNEALQKNSFAAGGYLDNEITDRNWLDVRARRAIRGMIAPALKLTEP